jgi:hypothetical protein
VNDDRHTDAHSRWVARRSRRPEDAGYLEQWYWEQCGGCVHWLALAGRLGSDWGVCSCGSSPFDGVVRFEHDGCDLFMEDPKGFGIQRG